MLEGFLPSKCEVAGLGGYLLRRERDAVSFEIAGFIIGAVALSVACISLGYQIGKDVNKRK